jgi:hypothetical protein
MVKRYNGQNGQNGQNVVFRVGAAYNGITSQFAGDSFAGRGSTPRRRLPRSTAARKRSGAAPSASSAGIGDRAEI